VSKVLQAGKVVGCRCSSIHKCFFYSYWVETESTRHCDRYWLTTPGPDDRWWWLWSIWSTEDWQGKPQYSEKTYPSVTLFTTNPTWSDPGANPGRCGGKPATNRLSYGAALYISLCRQFCGWHASMPSLLYCDHNRNVCTHWPEEIIETRVSAAKKRLSLHCHVLVTRCRVWIDRWVYWIIITRKYK
jgi:hypothetical protein